MDGLEEDDKDQDKDYDDDDPDFQVPFESNASLSSVHSCGDLLIRNENLNHGKK